MPRLGVMYEPDSVSPLRMAADAAKSWGIMWVIDDASALDPQTAKVLRRLGDIADISGLCVDEAAARLAEIGLDGLVSFADSQLVRTAAITARLGLPGHSLATARLLVDKIAQRAAFRSAGLPTPSADAIPGEADLAMIAARLETVTYPAVLKPVRGGSSRDTSLVNDASEALSSITDARTRRLDADMVLEGFIPGRITTDAHLSNAADYVSVESIVSGGHISTVAITGRTKPAEPFRETGAFMPSALEANEQRDVVTCAEGAARALGVRDGCLHIEIKLSPEGPRIIEVNGRVGGGGIPDMLEEVNGFSLLRAAARIALGESVVVDGPLPCEGVGYRFALQPPMSAIRLVSIEGMNDLLNLPGVDAVSLNKRPGEQLDWRDGTHNHLLTMNGVAADHQQALAKFDAMHAAVTVTFA